MINNYFNKLYTNYIILIYIFFFFRSNMKIKKKIIENNLPLFTEYFNLIVDQLLNRHQLNFQKVEAEDLMNVTHELNDFVKEYLKVIL